MPHQAGMYSRRAPPKRKILKKILICWLFTEKFELLSSKLQMIGSALGFAGASPFRHSLRSCLENCQLETD